MIYYVKARDRCVSLCSARCVHVRVCFWFKNTIFMDLNVVMDMDSAMMNMCHIVHLFTYFDGTSEFLPFIQIYSKITIYNMENIAVFREKY